MCEFFVSFSYHVVPFLLILSFLVFFHELGHYLVARWNGVRIEVFSIGFGHELLGWTDRRGTRWKISLLPLGGYVKMFSDLNAASQPNRALLESMTEQEKAESLFHKSVWQRMAVSGAGPIANYLLAILLLGGLYTFSGQRLPSESPKIGFVSSGSPAAQAGLQVGDEVISVNEKPIHLFTELTAIVQRSPGQSLSLSVRRGDSIHLFKVRPEGGVKEKGYLGVTQGYDQHRAPVYHAFYLAIEDTIRLTVLTVTGVIRMVMGEASTEGLSGPLGIASMTKMAAQSSLSDVVWLTAVLSVSLGFINLLPIPMLDGGHIFFYLWEALCGKPMSDEMQEWGYRLGFLFVLFVLLYATWNDLQRLQVFAFIRRLFY